MNEAKNWLKARQDDCVRAQDKTIFPYEEFDARFNGPLGLKAKTEPVKTRQAYEQKLRASIQRLDRMDKDLSGVPKGRAQ